MGSVAPDPTPPTRLSRSEQREQTRRRILDAVLSIAVDEGMRAVRHRAVADRAGVSLGSTTYHFQSIEELIISAFDHWRSRRQFIDNPFYREMVLLLQVFGDDPVPEAERETLAGDILELSVSYLMDQLTNQLQDRIVELAFYHESMNYPALRELVISGWATQEAFLEQVHRSMGSEFPAEDARLTSMLIRQWEQTAVMSGAQALDEGAIRRSLRRHMTLCLGVDIHL